MNRIRSALAVVAALLACKRRHVHDFNMKCEPPACSHCGRTGWAA